MKKYFSILSASLMALAFAMPLTSCSDDDNDGAKQYTLAVTLTAPSEVPTDSIDNLKLIVSSTSASDTIALGTRLDTTLTLRQGQYSLQVSGKVTNEATAYVSGVSSVSLYANSATTIALDKINQSSLIFKTIYTTGSKQYYMHEGYFEIVNNSDEVQYLDNVIVSAPMGNQTRENAWQANGMADLYNCGQGSIIAFPGNGHDYPLQPGQSVLVANDATNHKLAYGDDESQKDDYANCPDLSNADWEIYLDYNANDVDYPAQNMKVIFYNNRYMFAFGLGVMGRSFFMAKLPEGITPEDYVAGHTTYEPGSSSTYLSYVCFPSQYVLDAVDTYNPNTENHVLTFLPKDDATGVRTNESWSAQCLRRKVTRIANGRPYYKDTNSSADDFLREQPLTPGETPTMVDE